MNQSIDRAALNLKVLGRRSKKRVLVSAGAPQSKERLLPSVKKLIALNFDIYATEGTSRFLTERNIPNQKVYKITEREEPNIKSFLREERFDLIINVLTGDNDYDEASDSNLIRSLAVQNSIQLVTDVEVAMLTIDEIERLAAKADSPRTDGYWQIKDEFDHLVRLKGGLACHHAHFDKAFLVNLDNLELGHAEMQRKWLLYRFLKENYTREDLLSRMSRCIRIMIDQGVRYCRTMVDADRTVKTLPAEVMLELKDRFKRDIELQFGLQPLEGLLDDESRYYYEEAAEMADFLGGLPSKDRPTPEKHLDILFSLAKKLNKPVDVHVDQENNPDETETELLCRKAVEHGLEGRVFAVHAVSVSAKERLEQERIAMLMRNSGVGCIVCPSAALSMRQLDKPSLLHNSIAPVKLFLEYEVPVYLGVDNISDLFMPAVDGDLWVECRLMMEACRYYDVDAIAGIACRKLPKRVFG